MYTAAIPTKIRWIVLVFLFLATTLLYLDRSALGIMAPFLQDEIGWNEKQYGNINTAFMTGYAICFLIMGPLVDRIGTRWGYTISIALWALANASAALARSWTGFALSRTGLSIGQSGNFPVANKVLAEWFPARERAFATGLYNGGSNAGTMLAPLLIPALVSFFGNDWRIAFIWTLPLSILWTTFWLVLYRKPEKHKLISKQEFDYIRSDSFSQSVDKISWSSLVAKKEVWGICAGKFIADPIWWFYLFWGAKYLNGKYGLNLSDIGLPFFTIYLSSWLTGIFIGWLTSSFIKSGWSLNKGRKAGFFICAVFALPVMAVPHIDNLWLSVVLISLAAGGHCGWSANIFSLVSDIFPGKATATITGIAGFAGAAGGALAAQLVGTSLQNLGMEGYVYPFMIASLGYFFALGLIHLLIPEIKPLK